MLRHGLNFPIGASSELKKKSRLSLCHFASGLDRKLLTMVSAKDYAALQGASHRFLTNSKYELTNIEKVMEKVFGTNHLGSEPKEWAKYWNALSAYEEEVREGNGSLKPVVCY